MYRRIDMKRIVLTLLLMGMPGVIASADTLVLVDGTVIEGTIVYESEKYVKIETRFGRKTYRRKKISEIIKENVEESALHAIGTTRSFKALTDVAQELKNAEALYALGRYEEIPERVIPLQGKGTTFDEMRIRWLLIETYERQAKWDKVNELLDKTLEDGREPDKIRARAHKDIFEENNSPPYSLRKIGGRRAKEFLTREQWIDGKRRDALADGEMMRAALLEYIDQILRNERISLYKFQEDLEIEDTLELINERIEAGAARVTNELPYFDQMEKVQQTLYRVDAILPGYARGYELELVRIEAEHLGEVVNRLFEIALEAYPEGMNLATEGDSNRLTPDARRQWREASDAFLRICRPLLEITEYMLSRVRAFPVALREFIRLYEDVQERLEQMMHATVRNRNRATI